MPKKTDRFWSGVFWGYMAFSLLNIALNVGPDRALANLQSWSRAIWP